jgi:hypothetical protein
MASSRLAAMGFSLRPTGMACGTACTENYSSRTSVTLTAAPATFIGWGAACGGAWRLHGDAGPITNWSRVHAAGTWSDTQAACGRRASRFLDSPQFPQVLACMPTHLCPRVSTNMSDIERAERIAMVGGRTQGHSECVPCQATVGSV